MKQKTIRLAQVSDCHLLEDAEEELKPGINTDQNLNKILKEVARRQYDYLLLTGDIADRAQPRAYERLSAKLQKVQMPCYFVPGNHDTLANLAYLKGPTIHQDKHLIINSWQLVFLDSTKLDCTEGYLSDNELSFLVDCLSHNQDLFSVIVLHHHPIPSNSFMDEVMLQAADAFLNVIHQFQNAKCVLFGHVHQVMEKQIAHTLFLSAPAVAYQIKPGAAELEVDNLPPGYRWLELEYNGNIKTGVHRL